MHQILLLLFIHLIRKEINILCLIKLKNHNSMNLTIKYLFGLPFRTSKRRIEHSTFVERSMHVFLSFITQL